jgi:excisionase family DNA binding protein
MEPLLTIQDVATRLSISRARAYELVRRRSLPAVHLGRQVRVDVRALEEFLRIGGKTLAAMAQENS